MPRFSSLSTVLLAALLGSSAFSQGTDLNPPKRTLITQAADNQRRVTLFGNTRASANTVNDRGRVSEALPLEHMLLQLRRPAELEQAVERFAADVQNPAMPSYHQWLTAAEFGEKFGLSQSDIDAVTNWLQSQGFVVNQVYPNKLVIDFSGTAGMVRRAFVTEIHNLSVKGEMHIANMSDPQIPAALAPAVVGIASLHDFKPHSMKKPRAAYTYSSSDGAFQVLVPGDLATIYNLNPLFSQGITGRGQTIVVIEDTDVYNTSDWTTFRSTFGLSSYTTGSFTQVHPSNCSDPSVVAGSDGEATLDAEWASASAPGAAIELASCSDTETTFGGLIALQNVLNAGGTPPALVSISYGECEAANGAAANATYLSAYQQAVTEGVSVFVSAGDEGAASCDADQSYATHGIGVSAFASTPYNVAVGGTDFGDTYAGTNSNYWNSTNTSTYESAISYIPEIPWNDSCASTLISTYAGYSQTWGADGFCNSYYGLVYYLTTASGSGGPSGCATGSPSTSGVVGGSCRGYSKPSWQAGIFGNPDDGVRDIPDVSLFAANGVWGHYYVYCFTDVANGGSACSGAPSNWSGAGGTSFSSPILAGIQALVNQSTGSRWGNPNPNYYALAAAEYGSGGTSTCLSSSSPSSSCNFYDVTQGDMDVVCTGTVDCYDSVDGLYGVLSTNSSSLAIAYGTGNGWDFATGLGTINAYNLVHNWSSSLGPPSIVSVSPSSGSGTTQTFSAVYSDLRGAHAITTARILFNNVISASNTCYVLYNPATNAMYLENNAGSGASAAVTPGSASSVSNSQCTLAGSGSSVTSSGNNLTVNYALTFTSTFTGTKDIYLLAGDNSGSSGWIQKGTWTVVALPGVVSVTPSSGSGTAQAFAAVYTDPRGFAALTTVRLLMNTAISAANGCYLFYNPANGELSLENNAGNGLSGSVTPGSASSVSNSQCTLYGTGSSVSTSGNNMTVTYKLTFTSTFTGSKNIYLLAGDNEGSSNWIQKGTWTP
jgi:subtilase family serine protease